MNRKTADIRRLIAETGQVPVGMKLIRDTFNFKVIDKKNVVVEDVNGRDQKVMRVTGLFQEGDKPNANLRTYSTRDVLRPAVEAIQKDVERRAVLGEYDHPCITTPEFDALTPNGWKQFRDISIGDTVYSRVDGNMVESMVIGIVDKPFDGTVYDFDGRFIDTSFTGDHKVIMDTRNGKQVQATVSEIVRDRKSYNKHKIPKVAGWDGENPKYITIPAVDIAISKNRYKNDPTKDLQIKAEVFVSFLGLWLAEGSLVSNTGIFISQIKNDYLVEIEEMLSKFPQELKWEKHKKGYYLADIRLRKYLELLGNKYTKYVPENVKRLSAELLEHLVYWFQIGDGRKKHSRNEIFSVSKQLIDDLHECHVKSGGSGTRSIVEPKCDYEFAGHTIVATRKQVLHQLSLSDKSGIYLDDRFLKITPRQHTGNVYCLMTEHGSFYMKHNGHSFWTGNCDAKIHLDRVSHVITKLWIEDRKVYGEAEILHKLPLGACLRGLFEHKVEVGISSRGVGDMEIQESGGREYYRVMPGYSFVTWDAVAEPSVTGAILNIQESLQKRTKPIHENKARFSKGVYQAMLVREINDFFGLK